MTSVIKKLTIKISLRSSRWQTRASFIYCHFNRGPLLRKTYTHRTIYLQCIESTRGNTIIKVERNTTLVHFPVE
jgi:hypothetical protein